MSSKKKNKYYVVWVGKMPGVYSTWDQCKSQISNYPNAKYKSADTKAEAEVMFKRPWEDYYNTEARPAKPKVKIEPQLPSDFRHGFAVDASALGNPGKMEYRCVETMTGLQMFRSPVFPVGTNNIGEFLAIVHALATFHKTHPTEIIYSDSELAMTWIRAKKCRTKLPENPQTAKLMEVVRRAEKWLSENRWTNPIVKWETRDWGENPADFGRK